MSQSRQRRIVDDQGKVLLKSMTLDELRAWVKDDLGEKAFRADQLWSWLYIHLASTFDEMTNLSKAFRAKLAEAARIDAIEFNSEHISSDGTRKITWRLDSGGIVESVYIPADGRVTLCISSQNGCAMNCQFCLTGKMGLLGHLNTAAIVDQVVQTRRRLIDERPISNIVFMGMGEPLHNPDNVIPATNILVERTGLDFAARRVTLSTSGLVPQIERLGKESPVRLAVSLNATTNEVRDWIMPINRRYPLEVLLKTLREFPLKRGERITFEYVMLDGVNDTDDDARRIIKLLARIPSKVNLIPFNPHPGTEFRTSPPERIEAFREILRAKNMNVTVRETRGDDSMAACGQLGTPGQRAMPRRMSPPPELAHVVDAPAAETPDSP